MKNRKLIILIAIAFSIISCNPNKPKTNNTMTETNPETGMQHADWTKNANIYEVNIRQYTHEGTFNAFAQHLDRLHKMGVDILWIMPFQPIGEKNRKGGLGSYYSIKDYTAVNPNFGDINDLKAIVDKAHALGMHVIIDWVANHSSWDNKWASQHPDWYKKDSIGNFVSPFDWTDVIALNYDNPDLRIAMIDAMQFWIDSTDIDGFRCDVADLVPTDFWNEARKQLETKKPIFMLAEAEKPELQIAAFDMTYAWDLHHLMNSIAKGEKHKNDLVELMKKDHELFKSSDYRMIFTSNHDENSWNGTVYERMGNSYKMMAALSYMLPGMPLIYNGQEAGLSKRLSFFDKDEIPWDNLKLEPFYKTLNKIKHDNRTLWNGDFGGSIEFIETNNPNILFIKRVKDANSIFFICNLSAEEQDTDLGSLIDDGTILLSDSELLEEEKYLQKMSPWEFIILKENKYLQD